jgi:hypothetical protein
MKQPQDPPCKHAIPSKDWDECDHGWPCTGSFADVTFCPREMDCYEVLECNKKSM